MEYSRVKGMPERLVDLGSRRPKQLWYRGKWDKKLFAKCAAVVGSRRMTNYGERVVEKLVPQLVAAGFTIVSGFMYGVDQAAHRMAMTCGGRTVAVLGWGINYRKQEIRDEKLEEEIIKSGGLMLSEWEEQEPILWTFPFRNRIVAALASDVYVVEAAVKSGSLITARMGRELGRRIWAVPGPITSSVSAGTNALIAGGAAKIWLPQQQLVVQEPRDDEMLRILTDEELTIDEVARKLGRQVSEVGAQLSLMVLSGVIIEKDGKYYAS